MTAPATPATASVVPPVPRFGSWTRVVQVLAVFCLVTAAALVVGHYRSKQADPWKSPTLLALKDQLRQAPKDESLKEQIRALDLRLRQRYFRHLAFCAAGGWLLLAGTSLLVATAKLGGRERQALHLPQARSDAAERAGATARWARRVALATGGGLLLLLAGLLMSAKTVLPKQPAQLDKLIARLTGQDAEDAEAMPSPAEFAGNWPRFLGPTGNAFVPGATAPTNWNVESGAGVLWKTPVPVEGFNSPLVWSNRVFLSGGDATNRSVCAFDTQSGALVWQRPIANVPGSPAKPPEIPEGTGYAASTMATDGRRVYAMFANGDLAAITLEGRVVWARNLGVPHNPYGHATSLAAWQDRLIVQFDQGEAEESRSRLYALHGATGRAVWERPRPVGASWASPIVVDLTNRVLVVALGGQWAIAYSATDGAEVWRADCLIGEIAPSPIFAGGYVVGISPSDKVFALRPDGQGDVTQSHLVWTADDNVPDITSPVSDGQFVYTANSMGAVTCFGLADGKKRWEHETGFEVNASPAVFGDRLYLFGTHGEAVVLAAGGELRELARLELGEPVHASPAYHHGRLLVRTKSALIALGTAGASGPGGTEAAP